MSDRWQTELTSGEQIQLEPVLRRLDGRRVAGFVTTDDTPRFAKAFIGDKAVRDAEREYGGLRALRAAGLRSPALIERLKLAQGGELLVLERVNGTSPGRHDHDAAKALLEDMAKAHDAGVLMNDPHLDNVFIEQGAIGQPLIWLDGGDVSQTIGPISEAVGRRNACRLLAEFSPTDEAMLHAALRCYESARGLAPIDAEAVRDQLLHARKKRIRLIVAKTLRQCTAYSVRRTANGFTAWLNASSLPLQSLLDDAPTFEGLLADARVLKAGNSATVVASRLGDDEVVVKQTRAKSWPRLVRRVLKGSRARRSWSYGHLLRYFGLPTVQPLLVHERRIGPFVPSATLVCEALAGPTLDQTDSQSTQNVVEAARLIVAIHNLGLRHGDTKASNFVVTTGGVFVLDLDAIGPANRVDRERDRVRFLANFACGSEQGTAAREVFDRNPL